MMRFKSGTHEGGWVPPAFDPSVGKNVDDGRVLKYNPTRICNQPA